MIKVVLFGTGNLATHLSKAFSNGSQVQLTAVWGRTTPNEIVFNDALIRTSDLKDIPEADVYLICISDDAISEFSAQLPDWAFVVHCSGTLAMEAISQVRRGTFWPIQTFSKNRDVSFNDVPICVEAGNNKDLGLLIALAEAIKAQYVTINSQQRAYLHTAAVFVNNFVNELYGSAHSILDEQKLPFLLLHTLILETANKATKNSPREIQTGPAKRGDKNVMKSHVSLLNEEQKKLYVTLSEAIYKTHNNNEL